MKFIKLEIQNLASLDRIGGETINFEEGALGDSTIFSIVGPTGSGKSTILDAICLALYNRAALKAKLTEHDKNVCQQKVLTDRNAVISEQLKKYRIEELNKELEILLKSYALMTSENWALHRGNLTEGEACPLCGATHHPYSEK